MGSPSDPQGLWKKFGLCGSGHEPDAKRVLSGMVGFLPIYKVAGAAAEEGQSLDEVRALPSGWPSLCARYLR